MKTASQTTKFETWMKIKLGTGLRTGSDFYQAGQRRRRFEVEDNTIEMFLKIRFSTNSNQKRWVELVRVDFKEFELDPSSKKTSVIDICNRATQLGLSPCAEIAPQLILQAKPLELPSGKIWWDYLNLLIGMRPFDYYSKPSVLFIGSITENGGWPIFCHRSETDIGRWDRYPWLFKRRERK